MAVAHCNTCACFEYDSPRAHYMVHLILNNIREYSRRSGDHQQRSSLATRIVLSFFCLLLLSLLPFTLVTLTMAAMLNAFIRLGFSNAAGASLIAQGFATPEDLEQLTSEEIVGLCKSLRSPGGLIPNPAAVPGGDGALPPGVPLFVANPGENVGAMAEKSLKQAIYFVRHRIRISRPCTPPSLTLVNVRRLYQLTADETSYVEPDKPSKLLKVTAMKLREKMEDLESYFVKCLGTTKIPLAYVTRDDALVPLTANDPATNYTNDIDEMVARAPHGTATYNTDNSAVWDVMMHVFHGTDAYPWIKQFNRPRNGRAAYTALNAHYFGQSQEDNELNEAENTLTTTYYTGEKRNFTFETYAGIHRSAHNTFNDCRTNPMEERDKVRRLIDGIRCSDCKAAVTLIHADNRLRNNFDLCVDLIKTSLLQSKVHKEEGRRVSAVHGDNHGGRGRGGRGRGHGRDNYGRGRGGRSGGRGGRYNGRGRGRGRGRGPRQVSDRYYTEDEWYSMSYEDRQRVIGLRDHRTAPPAAQEDRAISSVTTPPVAAPVAAPAAAPNSNRDNPALARGNQRGTRPRTP